MPSELLFSRAGAQAWAAIVEAGRTVELCYADASRPVSVGDIFLARVRQVVRGLDAAFVAIGNERDALLPIKDCVFARAREASDAKRASSEARLTEGRELVVQVVRGEDGAKGPQVTGRIVLSGRLLVHFPLAQQRSISRRIEEDGARRRLATILDRLPPLKTGFVVRSAAVEACEEQLRSEAAILAAQWAVIREEGERGGKLRRLRRGDDLLDRALNDAPSDGFELVVVDAAADLARVRSLCDARVLPCGEIRLHSGSDSVLRAYGLEREFENALRPEVRLPSGGFLVLEETAALVAIDVNSGESLSGADFADTALRTNLEASVEIARQLRLRDLGGIIVVDFLHMRRPQDRTQIEDVLKRELRAQRVKTRVAGWSPLGLMELTREKRGGGLARPIENESKNSPGVVT